MERARIPGVPRAARVTALADSTLATLADADPAFATQAVHDTVLEDGLVPLVVLRRQVARWMRATTTRESPMLLAPAP